jgi:hypothetical protein
VPATAAIDNETLDHLLSVVNDSSNVVSIRQLSKAGKIRRKSAYGRRQEADAFPRGCAEQTMGVHDGALNILT